MVEHSTCGTDQDVDALPQLPCLVIDAHAAVDRQYFELGFRVPQFVQLIGYLERQFSRRRKDDRLRSSEAQ